MDKKQAYIKLLINSKNILESYTEEDKHSSAYIEARRIYYLTFAGILRSNIEKEKDEKQIKITIDDVEYVAEINLIKQIIGDSFNTIKFKEDIEETIPSEESSSNYTYVPADNISKELEKDSINKSEVNEKIKEKQEQLEPPKENLDYKKENKEPIELNIKPPVIEEVSMPISVPENLEPAKPAETTEQMTENITVSNEGIIESINIEKDIPSVDTLWFEKYPEDGPDEKTKSSLLFDEYTFKIEKNNELEYIRVVVYPMYYCYDEHISTSVLVGMESDSVCRAFISEGDTKNIKANFNDDNFIIRGKWVDGKFNSQVYYNKKKSEDKVSFEKIEYRPEEPTQSTHLIISRLTDKVHIFPLTLANDSRSGLALAVAYSEEENTLLIPMKNGQLPLSKKDNCIKQTYWKDNNRIFVCRE